MFRKNIALISSLGGALLLAFTASAAMAKTYDGYCYQPVNPDDNTRTKGTIIGAVAGGVLGNAIAKKGNKTTGTVIGTAVGGVAGSQVGAAVKKSKTKCLEDKYYILSTSSSARTAPEGYKAVFYKTRPKGMVYIKR
jgi:phage tail tape-measure protein